MRYANNIDLLRVLVRYLAIHPDWEQSLDELSLALSFDKKRLLSILIGFPGLFRRTVPEGGGEAGAEGNFSLQARFLAEWDAPPQARAKPPADAQSKPIAPRRRVPEAPRHRPLRADEIDDIYRLIDDRASRERADRLVDRQLAAEAATVRFRWAVYALLTFIVLVAAATLVFAVAQGDRTARGPETRTELNLSSDEALPPVEGNTAAISNIQTPPVVTGDPDAGGMPTWGWMVLGGALGALGFWWVWRRLRASAAKPPSGWARLTAIGGPGLTAAGSVVTFIAPVFTVQVDPQVHNLIALIFTGSFVVSVLLLILGATWRGRRLFYWLLALAIMALLALPALAPAWRAGLIELWEGSDQMGYVLFVAVLAFIGLAATLYASYRLSGRKRG